MAEKQEKLDKMAFMESHNIPINLATRNPGAGQDLTGLAAAVQLRLRVAT
jgi:hypothetical protein